MKRVDSDKWLKRESDLPGFLFVNIVRLLFMMLMALLILIIGKLVYEGAGVISWQFLTSAPSNSMLSGGVGPAIFGTVVVAFLMIVMAVPLGVAAAIYLSEYSDGNLYSRVIRTSVNNLAGVPSVVLGLFGLGFFVLFVGKNIDLVLNTGLLFGKPAIIWAAATLAVLVLPIIIITTFEALQAVPKSHRDASYALGASHWETIKFVVLPQAKSGILTGVILAISRGIGETAPILFLGCAFFLPNLPVADFNLFGYAIPIVNPADQFMSLSYHVFVLGTQSVNPGVALPLQYGSALVLIGLTVILNISAIVLRYRFRRGVGKS